MKILVDLGHPAHVHFFKNFIWNMEKKGHEILITARDKEVTFQLLNAYGFEYENVGKYGKSVFSKIKGVVEIDYKMYKIAKKFNTDILTGISVNAAHVSSLLRKSCIVFDDTEHASLEHRLYMPFSDAVCTPSCFKKDLGRKQVRYKGYHELTYLHPNYFKPNPEVLDELNLSKDDKFVILRFVSWTATHDLGQKGFSLESKIKLVKELEKYAKVFITSEAKLEKDLEKYRITISPEKIHDLLYYATIYIGEGATMATESAILGTPSIYVSSLVGTMGNFIELEDDYGLVYSFKTHEYGINKAFELLKNPDIKQEWAKKRERLLNDKIDVTKFMIDFIENYHESFYKYKCNYLKQ
ncbi:MAG: hypothetical protein BWK75_02945 [Candidatus Altiarchaeales archaeon A3]|nr:MAG: hypothetical protein BWK75_02945 [Candidatus Altiarchaeales archaeon A3]